jgi:phosphatidate cytidylyltransferase
MINQRIITACVLLLIFALILFVFPISLFVVSTWIICLMAIFELTKMYNFELLNQVGLMLISTLMAFLAYFINYDINQLMQIVILVVWGLMVPYILLIQPTKISNITIGIIAVLIFVPAFYALIQLYKLLGPWQLVSILAIAWISDIGAYFIGRKYGKRKLAIKISPNKSIEGALGGVALVLIYLLILHFTTKVFIFSSLTTIFKLGLLLTTIGIMGDLFESWLKRLANVKDSGNLLPGHGGVFDRIDSVIAITTVAFAVIWKL